MLLYSLILEMGAMTKKKTQEKLAQKVGGKMGKSERSVSKWYSSPQDMWTPDWDKEPGQDNAMNRTDERTGTIRKVPKGGKGTRAGYASSVNEVNLRG